MSSWLSEWSATGHSDHNGIPNKESEQIDAWNSETDISKRSSFLTRFYCLFIVFVVDRYLAHLRSFAPFGDKYE